MSEWFFLSEALDEAPMSDGVYEFAIVAPQEMVPIKTLYIGRGRGKNGIRGRLQAHINRTSAGNRSLGEELVKKRGRGTAVMVRWEAARGRSAQNMEVEKLRKYVEYAEELPLCNNRQEFERDGLLGLWDDLRALAGAKKTRG